ncbi:MAG: hypothetical protein K2Y08_00010 [Alphaproteobacteria bacterium]|nr:hypothetical protein [Alphaproteobacteria bacterium]
MQIFFIYFFFFITFLSPVTYGMEDNLTSKDISKQITRLTDKKNEYFGLANFYRKKTYQSVPRRKNISKKLKRDPKTQYHYRIGLEYRNAVTRVTKKIENLLELEEALLSPLENDKTQPTHSELVSSVSKFIEDTDQSLQNYNEISLKKMKEEHTQKLLAPRRKKQKLGGILLLLLLLGNCFSIDAQLASSSFDHPLSYKGDPPLKLQCGLYQNTTNYSNSSLTFYPRPICPSNPCDDPQLIPNIRAGWENVVKCHKEQGVEESLKPCEKDYLKSLSNYAYYPEVLDCLYKRISPLGQGSENKVYKTTLNHSFYNVSKIAVRTFIASPYGYKPSDIPHYLKTLAHVEESSSGNLELTDFFPKIYGVYFGPIPPDLERITLYEGTDINSRIIPEGLYDNYFLRGANTGNIPQNLSVRYVPSEQKHVWSIAILPPLYTEMELIEGGSLKDKDISEGSVIEFYFMEYALSTRNIVIGDKQLGNSGLQPVNYKRAYHKDDKIYLIKEPAAPKILDFDGFLSSNSPVYLFNKLSLSYFSHRLSGTKISDKSKEFIKTMKNNDDLFSKSTERYLAPYLISREQLEIMKENGINIKDYYL